MTAIWLTIVFVFIGGFLFAWSLARSLRDVFPPLTDEETAIINRKPLEICVMCNGIIREESHKSTSWIGAHEWCDGYY